MRKYNTNAFIMFIRWGMAFESLVQRSMLDHHIRDRRQKGKLTPAVKVMERSLQVSGN